MADGTYMSYSGANKGAISYTGPSGTSYRVAAGWSGYVHKDDVERLTSFGVFKEATAPEGATDKFSEATRTVDAKDASPYEGKRVDEMAALIEAADAATLDQIEAFESGGLERKGVTSAISERREALASSEASKE